MSATAVSYCTPTVKSCISQHGCSQGVINYVIISLVISAMSTAVKAHLSKHNVRTPRASEHPHQFVSLIGIEEGCIQKRRQRSSLLFGRRTWMPHLPFWSKGDLKKSFWKNIHLGAWGVWCGLNWKIIQLFQSIHSARNWINSVPQTAAHNICLLFCINPLQYIGH